MKASEIMQKNVTTCGPEDTLEAVAMAMWNGDCGAVPVIGDAGAPVGIITDRDIAMAAVLNHKPLWDIKARDVTNNRPLYTCKGSEDLKSALDAMRSHRIRRLPIVDDGGHLQGIISIDDVVALSTEQPREISFRDTMDVLKAVSVHH